MELKEIQKILIKHSILLDEERFLTGIPMGKLTECAKELKEAINYTRCCDELICDHCENIASMVICRCDKCDSNIH